MSREYRQLIATKAAPFETEEGGEALEEKRGLLSGRGAKPHVWRGNAGTHNAITALGRDAKRTNKRHKQAFRASERSGSSVGKATMRYQKLSARQKRLGGALNYLNRRAKRNVSRGALSYGDR